mmetsp:Transcript_7520/g.12109  ORF Transcript_7520/g.12109 Transcript_7520/m.12109 type:complete len:132 (+) Transcript_7520:1246-1641(+)
MLRKFLCLTRLQKSLAKQAHQLLMETHMTPRMKRVAVNAFSANNHNFSTVKLSGACQECKRLAVNRTTIFYVLSLLARKSTPCWVCNTTAASALPSTFDRTRFVISVSNKARGELGQLASVSASDNASIST